uniref:Reverse transcriptase zinc-binding domain-containing protein n=1 Tax=Helianthus annuus TaxID=4232 RepID=A0A251TGE5_HELAN
MESLPCYYFSLYRAPKKVISVLESMVKKFLWGDSLEERKMHWVAWDKVTRSKKNGGLGLNKLQVVNTSLLSKWGWRYKTENNSLWKKVIDAIHTSRVGWECLPYKKALNGVWVNIAKNFINTKVEGKPLKNFLVGSVGNGEKIAFWLDTWLFNEPLKTKFPDLFSLEVNKKCLVADRLQQDGNESQLLWRWISDILDAGLLSNLEQLSDALNMVQISAGMDFWKWGADPEGRKWIKFRQQALRKRNVNIGDPICPLCNLEDETVYHVFKACYIAANVWNGLSSWCKISNFFAFSIKDLLSFYKDLNVSEKKKEAVQGIILIVCWSIWRARNNVKFSNATVRIDSIISEIKALGFLWFSSRSKHKGVVWRDWVSFVNM